MLKGKDGDIYFESATGVPCSVRGLWERIEKLENIIQNLSSSSDTTSNLIEE
jgi:tetrahydromethanopterin S-methyltransferase subunit B